MELESRTTVLLCTDSTEPSGMGQHMLDLGRELQSTHQYRVLFACPATPSGKTFLSGAHDYGLVSLPISTSQELANVLTGTKIDVLHMHAGIGWEGHDGIYRAREARIPAVIRTEHLPYLLTDPEQQCAYAELVNNVDKIVCVSTEARNSFVRAGVPENKIVAVHNGIHICAGVPDKENLHAELGLPPEAKICLTIGRMTEQKGHSYLLDAIGKVIAEEPNAYFLWVGTGPLQEALRQSASERRLYRDELNGRLRFLGRRGDVARLIASSDLFVLPSLFEGLPLAVLEAMSGKLAIVATAVTGTREAIEDGVSGRLVPARDIDALTAAVVESLSHPELTAIWRHNAYARLQDRFTVERMSKEVADIYRDTLTKA